MLPLTLALLLLLLLLLGLLPLLLVLLLELLLESLDDAQWVDLEDPGPLKQEEGEDAAAQDPAALLTDKETQADDEKDTRAKDAESSEESENIRSLKIAEQEREARSRPNW